MTFLQHSYRQNIPPKRPRIQPARGSLHLARMQKNGVFLNPPIPPRTHFAEGSGTFIRSGTPFGPVGTKWMKSCISLFCPGKQPRSPALFELGGGGVNPSQARCPLPTERKRGSLHCKAPPPPTHPQRGRGRNSG